MQLNDSLDASVDNALIWKEIRKNQMNSAVEELNVTNADFF
jgi:hypothetical protein